MDAVRIRRGVLIVVAAAAGLAAFEVQAWVDQIPKPEQYRSGLETYVGATRSLKLPTCTNALVFKASEKQASFTGFENVKEVGVKDGALGFIATSNTVLLDWGNFSGRQDLKDIESIPVGVTHVTLKVRQTGGAPSKWSLRSWSRDGGVVRGKRGSVMEYLPADSNLPAELTAGEWQDLKLVPGRGVPLRGVDADGLEIQLETEPGARFEIAEIKFVAVDYRGYVRSEFTVPEGKIWRAIANVGASDRFGGPYDVINKCELDINGQRVERLGGGVYGIEPVDIRPYLKPGKNCIGIYGWRDDYSPFIFVSGSAIMESGEIIPLKTDAAWQFSQKAPDGWSKPGFDAAGWQTNLPPLYGMNPGLQTKLPGWTGYLELIQPGRKDLTFRDDQPALMNIRIPAVLAAKSPTIKYELAKSDKYGHCEIIRTGEVKRVQGPHNQGQQSGVSDPGHSGKPADNKPLWPRSAIADDLSKAEQDGSLVYALDAGKLQDGVYTLALSLRDSAGNVMEDRPVEPLMVLRKLNLKEVSCEDVKQGLDLDLEFSIDFTNPKVSLPQIEVSMDTGKSIQVTNPAVITKDGLIYRELVGKSRDSFMSYRVEFKHPGDFYLCEVEYPDNADRCIETLVSKSGDGNGWNTVIGVGAETGGKFYKTGRMQKLPFLFGAPGGPATIDVKNTQSGWPAAVKSVTMYHVKGDLVSAGSGRERAFSIVTERDALENSFCRSFRPEFLQNKEHNQEFTKLPYLQQVLIKLAALKEASEKYAQYLKFTGQNARVIGCYQYHPANTPYIPFYHERVVSSVVPCIRSVLANCLDVNDIPFYAGVEVVWPPNLSSSANMAAVRKGAESVWFINDREEQQYPGGWNGPNWLAPGYQSEYFRLLRELDNTFGNLKNYSGVCNLLSPCHDGGWVSSFPAWGDRGWNPLAFSYDDLTFRLFAEETGLKLGIDPQDPSRFAKRANLIQTNPDYQKRFLAWRNDRLYKFLSEAAAVMREKRKDLRFINTIAAEDPVLLRMGLDSGRPFKEFLKDYGYDFDRLGGIENLVLARWTLSWTEAVSPDAPGLILGAQIPETWVTRENEDYTSMLNAFPHRGVFCRTTWNEGVNTAPKDKNGQYLSNPMGKLWNGTDWLLAQYHTRSSPLPGVFHAREALLQALITSDPEMILTGFVDVALNGGHEQIIRQIMRLYTRLPRDTFRNELDTSLKSNLAIRSLSKNGQAWLYAANPGYWAIDGTIAIETEGKVCDLADGKDVAKGGKIELKVKLEPFGLAAWRIESQNLKVLSYQTGKISAPELAYMQDGIIGRVNTLLEDKKVKRVLSPADRKYMRDMTDQAAALLAKDQYAAAWALLKTPTFWNYWKFYLEKAAEMAVFLPEQVAVPERASEWELPKLTAVKAERVDLQADIVNAPEWQKVPASAEFLTMDSAKRTFNPTVVKACYDDRHLYFGFICADPDSSAVKTEAPDDMAVFSSRDDILGIFFQPNGGENLYYQLITNTKGVGYEQKARFGIKDNKFTSGREVVCQKYPGYWTAVIKVPRETIGATGTLDNAKANFYRVMRDNLLQIAVWSPIPNTNRPGQGGKLHDKSRFGQVVFR